MRQVSAQDKASGKTQKITITSDKGRLSEEEIQRMVREAEEHAEEDKAQKSRVESKNQLESYLYSVKNSLDGLKSKITEEENTQISTAVSDALKWLEENPLETKDAYDEKRISIEGVVNPVFQKAYQSSPPESNSPNDDTPTGNGPTVEEAD